MCCSICAGLSVPDGQAAHELACWGLVGYIAAFCRFGIGLSMFLDNLRSHDSGRPEDSFSMDGGSFTMVQHPRHILGTTRSFNTRNQLMIELLRRHLLDGITEQQFEDDYSYTV
ncbi:hypothetical protein Hypma_011435 [Hypsizygus marmoreus]|uniref:Uncharacterized protein n=1 Tax=Hypsizygus marmoreus TaxID=39966 RepID=A0A369JRA3_HYPMA|nr:hypothetical protein Hypma_011435 [Hypsizygus marmoreus]